MPRGRSLRLWQGTPAQDTGTVSAWPGARAGATAPFTAGTAQGQGSKLQPRGQAELMVRVPRH